MQFRNLATSVLCTLAGTLSLSAQCYEPNTGTLVGTGDDTVFGPLSLGISFPFNGTTYTDCYLSTNGIIYLSNGALPTTPGSGCCTGAAATLVASASPMVCPFWTDMNVVAGTGELLMNSTIAGKSVVTWQNVYEYGTTVQRSFQCTLWDTGEIDFTYDGRNALATHTALVGMSEGGGAALPAASDFSTTNTSTTTTNFETYTGTFDLAGKVVQFFPTSPGYLWVPANCAGNHEKYGSGCYSVSDSVYSLITSPATASAALSGTAVMFIPTGTGYVLTNGGTYVAPGVGATALVLTDDSSVMSPTLTTPFPYAGGTATELSVCSNGHVAVATGNAIAYAPNVATMLNTNTQTAWYSWHDFNPGAVGSGSVMFEEVGTTAYVTWDGVYNYGGTTAADASTLQFQFDCATGIVTIAWQSISAAPHSGFVTGEPTLVGYSPGGGPSNDTGSVDLATGLPVSTSNVQMNALSLSAAPAPISTPSSGSVVTYTIDNIPEFVPASGIYIGLQIYSFGQVPAPGLDLAFLGMPDCRLHVASLDVVGAQVGVASSQTNNQAIPMGLPQGVQIFAQGAALVSPNSLPNGQNSFGAITSNGIATTVGSW